MAKKFVIIIDEERTRLKKQLQNNNKHNKPEIESNVRNIYEVHILHLGSMLVEKEVKVVCTSMSTSMSTHMSMNTTNTRTSTDINNDNIIKFEYSNNIKFVEKD